MKFATAAIAAFCILLTACDQPQQEPVAVERTSNGYEIKKLFSHEDCTVYRFYDGGYDRYFTKCQGAAADTSWKEGCGKNCSRKQSITTEPTE